MSKHTCQTLIATRSPQIEVETTLIAENKQLGARIEELEKLLQRGLYVWEAMLPGVTQIPLRKGQEVLTDWPYDVRTALAKDQTNV